MDPLRIKYDADQLNPPWSVAVEKTERGSAIVLDGKGQRIAIVEAGFRNSDRAVDEARKGAQALCRIVNSIHELAIAVEKASAQ